LADKKTQKEPQASREKQKPNIQPKLLLLNYYLE